MHGVVDPLFEEHMECSNLIEDEFNYDTLSYCCKKLDYYSFRCDSENDNDVASHDVDNKVFDKVINENQHAPCNEFYDEYFKVTINPFAKFKGPFEDSRLVLDADIDDMCEYKSDFSFEYHPVMHKDTQF